MYEKEDAPTERVKLLTLLSGEEDFELSRFVSSHGLLSFTPAFNSSLSFAHQAWRDGPMKILNIASRERVCYRKNKTGNTQEARDRRCDNL